MKFKKLMSSLVCAGLLASVVSVPVFAEDSQPYADENGYGVVVTRPTADDLNGPYGKAYEAAGYKATFKVNAELLDFGGSQVDLDNEDFELWVGGTMQFYNPDDVTTHLSKDDDYYKTGKDSFTVGNASTLDLNARLYSAYEYQKGLFSTGFDVLRADCVNFKCTYLSNGETIPVEDYNLLELNDKVWVDAGSNSVIYQMEKVEGENYVYTLSLPVPSTEFLYKYYATPYSGRSGWGGTGELVSYAKREGFAGAFDPANMPEINEADGMDPGWSYFFVGDGSEALPTQEYIFPRTDGKTGKWEYVSYEAVDGSTQWLQVYLPYGYDSSKTYKTIYLSHGGGGDETEWSQVGAAGNIMDNLIAEGKTEPAVVVCMNNSTIWSMSRTGEGFSAPIGWDLVWENMKDYIVPFVEENYSVSKEASDRAVAGLSQGGRTVTNYMLHDPTFFRYVGAFSGFECNADEWAKLENPELLKNTYIYTAAGNVDFGLGYYNQDPATDARMAYTLAEFNALLENAGAEYDTEVLLGAHDWSVWRGAFSSYVQKIWKADETAAPSTDGETSKTTDPVQTSVKTGDATNIIIPVALLAVSGMAIFETKKRLLNK